MGRIEHLQTVDTRKTISSWFLKNRGSACDGRRHVQAATEHVSLALSIVLCFVITVRASNTSSSIFSIVDSKRTLCVRYQVMFSWFSPALLVNISNQMEFKFIGNFTVPCENLKIFHSIDLFSDTHVIFDTESEVNVELVKLLETDLSTSELG
jgi:hypothetical protein